MTAKRIEAIATSAGLTIEGQTIDRKEPLACYRQVLGVYRTIYAGKAAPAGHRNNQVHVFDAVGIYLTEHHASQLIESVNFVFDPSESPFPIDFAFCGDLRIDGQELYVDMPECELDLNLFARDLPGEYRLEYNTCWIGVSAKGRPNSRGERQKKRYVVRVSVCF